MGQGTARSGAKQPRNGFWLPATARSQVTSNFCPLCQCQCILHIYPEVADRAFDLPMFKQNLDGAEIPGRLCK